ncbi:MAG: o-succinylbenzoate synthase [Chloroflexi bacterium]|nr:o-succinylbenzoate synthase [Chloroflexota bacterium]
MKLEKITLSHLRMPLVSHFETSFGRIFDRDSILITIQSEGLIGYGECAADRDPGYGYETSGTAWHILKDFILPAIQGKEVVTPEDFRLLVGNIKGHEMAKAGVEMAIWDLIGKKEGKSLQMLLGGSKSKVDVGVSVGLQDTPEDLLRVIENYLKDGYGRVKLKIKPGRDVGDVAAARAAFPNLKLQVDANSAYTLETAKAIQPLDDLNLLLIEQPLAEDDLWDHHILQQKFKTPLCLDETIISARHTRQAIEMDACRIVNIKAGRVGGISESLAIHDLCYTADIPVWCGGMLETGIGRAANLALASLPNFKLPGDISATDRYYDEDITHERFTLNADSTIDVPTGVGLGVTINESAVKNFTMHEYSL